jgi:hypothetical protein
VSAQRLLPQANSTAPPDLATAHSPSVCGWTGRAAEALVRPTPRCSRRPSRRWTARLATIPRPQDKITPTATVPTVLVALEEFPGLLRAASSVPKPKSGKSLAERIVSAQLRLLSEGRKAAFRVLTLAQRFEATAVGGGYAPRPVRPAALVPGLGRLAGDAAR